MSASPHKLATPKATRLSPQMSAQWSRVRAMLRGEIGEDAYDNWIKVITLDSIDGGVARLLIPNRANFRAMRFNDGQPLRRYGQHIRKLWNSINSTITDVAFFCAESGEPMALGAAKLARTTRMVPSKPTTNLDKAPLIETLHWSQEPGNALFEAHPKPEWNFDNFLVDRTADCSNRLAHGYACQFVDTVLASWTRADNPSSAPAAPQDNGLLLLYGGIGHGKSHLLNAIANRVALGMPADTEPRRVMLLGADKFTYFFVRSLQEKKALAFKQQLRQSDLLLIDDLHFLCGKPESQKEIFHTISALLEDNKHVALSSAEWPLENFHSGLRSRLRSGYSAQIHAPKNQFRAYFVEEKARSCGLRLENTIVHRLSSANTIKTLRELEGAVKRIASWQKIMNRTIREDELGAALDDLLNTPRRRLSIDTIQSTVAQHFAISVADLNSKRRMREIARPRQVAMYLAKKLTNRSLPEIGRKFGNRDHTTVIHAVRRIEHLIEAHPGLRDDIGTLKRGLTESHH